MKRLLMLAPDWKRPSELWLRRIGSLLAPHLVAYGCMAPQEARWYDDVPAFDLLRPNRWPQRLTRRMRAFVSLAELVERQRIDIVLCHYATLAVELGAELRRLQTPIFVHCHGWDVTWDLRRDDHPWLPRHAPWYARSVRGLRDLVTFIANSKDTAARLHRIGVSPARIVLKHLGVPVPPQPLERPSAPQLEVLYLGRLVDFKGPEIVLRAFDRACDMGFGGRLTIAGEGPRRRACEDLARSSKHRDRIRFLGAVDAAAGDALRAQAHIFTAHNCVGPITRQAEAFGVSIVEAMAAGLPVVTGASAGVMETVVDGVTGLLVPPGDVDAHAKALIRLEHEPALRGELGRNGHARAARHFSDAAEREALHALLGLAG